MTEVDTSAEAAFLREQHALSCYETGDHPDEGHTAYSVALEAITERDALKAEVDRLQAMVRQMHGMSLCVTSAPEVLGRWVERIDEVAINGPQPEYADYEHYNST